MSDNRRVRVHLSNLLDAVLSELNMDITGTFPEIHFSACLLHHPGTQVLVWNKKNVSIRRRVFYHFDRVAASTNDIGQAFETGATIDMGDDVLIRIQVPAEKISQRIRRAGVGK